MDAYSPQRYASDRAAAQKLQTFGRDDILKAMDSRWWLISEIERRTGVSASRLGAFMGHMARDGVLEVDYVWNGEGQRSAIFRKAVK